VKKVLQMFGFAVATLLACGDGFARAEQPNGSVALRVGAGAACPYHTIQDAVDAAAQHPGEDFIELVNDQTYAGQHVVITGKDVGIQGGFIGRQCVS
jgi:hypothetical protein